MIAVACIPFHQRRQPPVTIFLSKTLHNVRRSIYVPRALIQRCCCILLAAPIYVVSVLYSIYILFDAVHTNYLIGSSLRVAAALLTLGTVEVTAAAGSSTQFLKDHQASEIPRWPHGPTCAALHGTATGLFISDGNYF